MKQAFNEINQIQVPTWRWLHVNHVGIDFDYTGQVYNKDPISKKIDGIKIESIDRAPSSIREKLNKERIDIEVKSFVEKNCNHGYYITIPKGFVADEPIVIEYILDDDSASLVDETIIVAEEGSSATIVIQYTNADGSKAAHCGLTYVVAQSNAQVTLIKAQTLSEESQHIDYVSGITEKNSNINLILIELGAKQAIGHANIELLHDESSANIDSLFIGRNEQLLDFNYRVAHHGKATQSDIEGRGVLLDRCRKVFRGTLDFLKGASASAGNETEFVVLLSDQAKNLSVPLMLCAEDDVQGAHAASAGKIDENKMFYLESRGLNEVQAKKLIVEAEFTPILAKIPTESLREQLTQQVRRSLEHVK